eukprot:GHVS01089660.1.p1 GENE.GHVS01089660.1~~GHVS01089660.1.p1  ORF type:complete len:454 (+),score=114.35 GHVS01089660.1:148-1509(+)
MMIVLLFVFFFVVVLSPICLCCGLVSQKYINRKQMTIEYRWLCAVTVTILWTCGAALIFGWMCCCWLLLWFILGMRLCVIGLTGGIGTGKSTLSNWINQKYSISVVDADIIARDILLPGRRAYREIIRHFGRSILQCSSTSQRHLQQVDDDKQQQQSMFGNTTTTTGDDADPPINRSALRKMAFSSDSQRMMLNRITHFYILIEILKQIVYIRWNPLRCYRSWKTRWTLWWLQRRRQTSASSSGSSSCSSSGSSSGSGGSGSGGGGGGSGTCEHLGGSETSSCTYSSSRDGNKSCCGNSSSGYNRTEIASGSTIGIITTSSSGNSDALLVRSLLLGNADDGVLLDAPLLVETRLHWICSPVVSVIVGDAVVQAQRVNDREEHKAKVTGEERITHGEVLRIVGAQVTDLQRIANSNEVIINNRSKDDMFRATDLLMRRLLLLPGNNNKEGNNVG